MPHDIIEQMYNVQLHIGVGRLVYPTVKEVYENNPRKEYSLGINPLNRRTESDRYGYAMVYLAMQVPLSFSIM